MMRIGDLIIVGSNKEFHYTHDLNGMTGHIRSFEFDEGLAIVDFLPVWYGELKKKHYRCANVRMPLWAIKKIDEGNNMMEVE